MLSLNRRLARVEDLLTRHRLPSDTRRWKADDFIRYFEALPPGDVCVDDYTAMKATMPPDELEAFMQAVQTRRDLEAQATQELEAWEAGLAQS